MNVNREVVNALIASFARENKVNKGKLSELVNNALANVKVVTPGRKTNETSVAVRDFIKNLGSNACFTVKDVSTALGVSISNVNSNIRALKREGAVEVKGRNRDGSRGNPALVWTVL